MAWFDRNLGKGDARAAWEKLGGVVERAGLAAALDAASGRSGLRRFVVRFELRGGRPRVTGLDADTLPMGGGPPPASSFDANVGVVEAALGKLAGGMPEGWRFDRGALAFVRDGEGELLLLFRFDEDADAFTLAELPMPGGSASPVEEPRYLKALAAWDTRIAPVRAQWVIAREEWALEDGRLTLGERVLRADAIATFEPATGRFEWRVDAPVGDEAPFVEPTLTLEMNGATELVVFAAARMGRVGVFQGETGEGVVVFAGVKE